MFCIKILTKTLLIKLDQEVHEDFPSIVSSTHMGLKASGTSLKNQINKGMDAQD